jgi:CelD/BcsL family acetyltransferase involved in cellulose biosynthesis
MVNFNLYLNDQLISSSLCFQSQKRFYVFKITYDEEYGKYSPGLLLRLYELEYCFRNGIKKYDFSGTAQKWMKFFTNRSHFSMDIIIYQRHFSSLVRYLGYTKLKNLLLRFPSLKKLFKNHLME